MRHRKSCASSSAVGSLNAWTNSPCGFSLPKTLRMAPSFPLASIPWMMICTACFDSAYNRFCRSSSSFSRCAIFSFVSFLSHPLGARVSMSFSLILPMVLRLSLAAITSYRRRERRCYDYRSCPSPAGVNAAGTITSPGLGGLYRHDLLFLGRQMLFHERDMLVGDVLDLFFGIFSLILAESVLLEFLYLFDGFATDITYRHARLL